MVPPHLFEKLRAVTFAVEDDDEAMAVGVLGELLGRGLSRDVRQQPRHDVAFQRFQQPLVD